MQALFHFWSNIIYQLVNKGKPVNTLCTRHIMIQFSIFRTEPSNALNRTQQHFCRNYCARADKLLQGTLRIKFQENLTKRTRVLRMPFFALNTFQGCVLDSFCSQKRSLGASLNYNRDCRVASIADLAHFPVSVRQLDGKTCQ